MVRNDLVRPLRLPRRSDQVFHGVTRSLRARLKPRGDELATLMIVVGLGPARDVLARRAGLTAGA